MQGPGSLPNAERPPDGRIPRPLTPLIGRITELDKLTRLVAGRQSRLLVLTGPGGVGKTRLAIALSEEIRDHFKDGVLLINLESATQGDQLLPIIATALGIITRNPDRLYADVLAAVEEKDMLLMLDNLEQIVDSAPIFTDMLLSSHTLSIVVTSRSVLDVYGEHVFPVPPMTLPSTEETDIATIGESEAVQLFVDRVSALRPDFSLTERNASDIAHIVAWLDGIPLAIELAAARTSLFSVADLANRLHQRLPLLEGISRNVPNRQRTMRNAINWSYDLLPLVEQRVLRQLSVFTSAWTLESAQEMLGTGDLERDMALVQAIGSLVDKSLVQRIESTDRDRTFRLLHTLREFSADELDAHGEREETETRHTTFILNLARRASPHLTGREQIHWLDQLDHHAADVAMVFERLLEQGETDSALELMTLTWRHASVRGNPLQTRQYLLRALDISPEPTVARGRALNAAGILSNMMGDPEAMTRYYQEALEIGRANQDPRIMATALFGIGDQAMVDDKSARAESAYLEAERLYTRMDDTRGIATAQTNLGNLYWAQGKLDDALKLNEAALRLYETAGDQLGLAWSYTNVGRLSAELSNTSHAAANLAEAMALYELLGNQPGIAETMEGFAMIATSLREFRIAARLLGAADHLRTMAGHPVPKTDQASLNRTIKLTQEGIGDEFASAFHSGAMLSLDRAIQLTGDIHVPADTAPKINPTSHEVSKLGITERELQVLQKLGGGATDKQIAESLFISPRTVQSHVQNLLSKLDVTSRSAAVAMAFRLGLLK